MEQLSFFDREEEQPLASRLRPRTLEEYVGQTHLLGPGKVLRRLIESDRISSMIFWGPPGVGKTTLARVIACLLYTSIHGRISFQADRRGPSSLRGRWGGIWNRRFPRKGSA